MREKETRTANEWVIACGDSGEYVLYIQTVRRRGGNKWIKLHNVFSLHCCYAIYAQARRILPYWVKKVNCTLLQALRLCTGRTAYRGSRGTALLFHDHSTRRGWGVSVTPRPIFTTGKDPVLIVQEAGWAPGPVWTGAKNLAPTGIRSPDRPARSQSLYRLRCPVPYLTGIYWIYSSAMCVKQTFPSEVFSSSSTKSFSTSSERL
jgi:hypothetical protein